MTETQVFYANVISNIVGLAMLLIGWRWRTAGRVLFVALFLWAAQTNMRFALTQPTVYLEYARWAIEPYQRFILGSFSQHITSLVALIAVGQLGIALLVASRGRVVTLGLAGAVLFLLAIAPLGRGAAFPFSLTVSVAALVLMRQPFERSLPAQLAAWVRRRKLRAEPAAPK
jgi:hypothetical protein